MELLGNVKCYEWGKVGSKSKVAQLAKLNADGGDRYFIHGMFEIRAEGKRMTGRVRVPGNFHPLGVH